MRRVGPAVALLLSLAQAGQAVAADPPEWLGIPAGGLTIAEAPEVVLMALHLRISADRVVAAYRLVNGGEHPVTLAAAFPISSITRLPGEGPPVAGAFSDAEVRLDGRLRPLDRVGLRVFMDAADVTQMLVDAGIDLAQLATGLTGQSRTLYRAMEQALVDQGIALDPLGWRLVVEPTWQLPIQAYEAVTVTLAYTPYPGGATDRLPADEPLPDLAHLAPYCADKQKDLLAWVQGEAAKRGALKQAELQASGLSTEAAAGEAYADFRLLDLSFLLGNGGWPEHYPLVEVTIDPLPGRATFCFPTVPERGADGRYRATAEDLPAAGSLDVMIIR